MKKYFTLLLGALLCTFVTKAQTTIYDGETVISDFWDIGGNPPNGTSCPSNAAWTLNVSGKMDILTEGLANPFPLGLNTTEKVVRSVRAKDGEGWAGASLNVSGLNLNINQTNHFSVLVYKEIEGNVTMKLEGAGSQEVTAYYNTPGQWQKMEFTFNAANFTGSPTTMLIFPHNQTGLSETIITYWDEVTMYDAINTPIVIYNGNDPVSGFFLDGYWGPNGSLNNLETDVFPNLNKSGINTSNHAIRFLRAKDGESWCGIGLGGLNINVTSTPVVSLMILKNVSGKVGAKLEGAGSQEIYADYNTPGQWARLTFTFDKNAFSGNPNTLIIFPHFEDTKTVNLADHTPMYIDNVVIRDNSTVATDYFRSKTSGNWGDINTWESSYNNVNWVTATSTPTSMASSITIKTGNLVTVTNNTTASDLTLQPGAKLTLNAGNSLNVSTLSIQSDATNGTGTFVDNGTFTSPSSNVQQYLTSGRNWYISSPVNAVQVSTINGLTGSSVVGYDEVHSSTVPWPAVSSMLIPAKGYIVVSPVGELPVTINFNGTLNTGPQSIALTRTSGQPKEGFNLVGNPYPSFLNWSQSMADAANALTTIWYRTKTGGAYVFNTYNASNGIGVPANINGTIPPMQAFWVRVNAGGGLLSFDNTMRSHTDSPTNILKAPVKNKTIQQLLRLQVSNGISSDETVIAFNPNATDGVDLYDSPKMTNANATVPEIYTNVGDEELVINSLTSFATEKQVAIGFRTGMNNAFTMRVNQMSDFDANTQIILRDNLLNIEQVISDGSEYSFNSVETTTNTRFTVIFRSSNAATNLVKQSLANLQVYSKCKGQIVICGKEEFLTGDNVSVCNITGQHVMSMELSHTTTVLNSNFTPGIYIVKLTVGKEKKIEKIIVK